MKTNSIYSLLKMASGILLAGLLLLPQSVSAQRFYHRAPTAAAARGVYPYHPVYPYPRPYPVPVRPIPRPIPVPVPVPVPVPAWHFPYAWHPFVPYYWGPYWHPVGFMVATLTTAAIIISIDNATYHYDNGVYYVSTDGGFKVVPAPIGAEINSLPHGYAIATVTDKTYYYYGGTFYVQSGSKYRVVAAPAGAIVNNLPEGTAESTVNGQKYMIYNGVFYEPISHNGQDAYIVTETKSN